MGQMKTLLTSSSELESLIGISARVLADSETDKWRLSDQMHEINVRMNHELGDYVEHEREYRYEERAGEYRLRCWVDGTESSETRLIDDAPEWLQTIIATSKVGGYMKYTSQPPPDCIVWFVTDADKNLLHFLELK